MKVNIKWGWWRNIKKIDCDAVNPVENKARTMQASLWLAPVEMNECVTRWLKFCKIVNP